MKLVISALISAVVLISAPAFAASHGGGKMKTDCSKQENKEHQDCKKK